LSISLINSLSLILLPLLSTLFPYTTLFRSIVFQTGFSSTNYFNRVFREYYNCTPTEYRRDNRNGESQNTNYINKKSKSYLDVDRVSVFESLFKYLNLSPSNIKAETRYSINTVKENIIIDINKSEEKKYNPY